jgi:hypothetical protein
MPTIHLSPEVPNYFVQMDWQDRAAEPARFSDELMRHYEAGEVVILKNAPVNVNFDLVNRITLPAGRFKKASDNYFLYPNLISPSVAQAIYSGFGVNIGLYLAFRREVARVSADLRRLARSAFAKYRFTHMGLSWRFTETEMENMHIDAYSIDDDLQYVRIFMNLDTRARCWNTSYRLDELVPRYYADAQMQELQSASADAFNNRLNEHAFGGKAPGCDGFPRHVVEFQMGDVWIFDSRLLSHQVVSGRRMIATNFQAEPASMLDPSLSLENRVRGYHRQYGHQEFTSRTGAVAAE